MSSVAGWGRGTWGQGGWGNPLPVEVSGLAATSALGTVTLSLGTTVSVSGQAATSALGTVSRCRIKSSS
jgi:hypothetical protein